MLLGPLEVPAAPLGRARACAFRTAGSGLCQEAPSQRAFERHPGPAGVQGRSAPIVVGVVRGGGEDEEDGGTDRGAGRTTKNASARSSPAVERHRVVAGSPVLAHRDREGGGPPTAVGGRGSPGHGCSARPTASRRHTTSRSRAVARDLHRRTRSVDETWRRDLLAGERALRPAVAVEQRGPTASG